MKNKAGVATFIFNFLRNFNESIDMKKSKKLSDYSFYILEKIIFNFRKFLPLYIKFYKEMVNEEIKMANISSNDKILHIGCGSIPATSILIAEKTGAQITAIDINYSSAHKAKQLIKKNTKVNNIEIKHADGAKFPVANFDIILISDGVKKLYSILQNIVESLNNTVKVIFRKTIIDNENFKLGGYNISPYLEIKQIKTHKSYGNLSSILLIKLKSKNFVKND